MNSVYSQLQWRGAVLLILMLLIIDASAALRDIPVTGKPRSAPIKQVVIHTTGGADCEPAQRFQSGTLDRIVAHFLRNRGRISIHYIIDRNGDVVRMVPESQVAHHVRGENANSIGIELVNNGDGHDQFLEAQMVALIALLREILPRYQLTFTNLKSHAELDHSYLNCGGIRLKRKSDPGAAFPWTRLAQELTLNTAAVAIKQRNQKSSALQAIIRQLAQRERDVRAQCAAISRDQQDANTALRHNPQIRPAGNERMASIEEAINQLTRRAAELRLEILGVMQAQLNAKAALRQLRLESVSTLKTPN